MNDAPSVQNPSPEATSDDAFTAFMRSYQNMVYSTALRLVSNEAQAEDISQDVFLKAFEHFDMLRGSASAGGWLKTVATNLSLNHLQRYRRRWSFFSELKREDDGGAEADADFPAPDTFFSGMDADERRKLIEEALAQLPDHQRIPIVLYHFDDLSYEEISARLHVSLAKVKTDILRARTALARIFAGSALRETF